MINNREVEQYASFAQWFIHGVTLNLSRNLPAATEEKAALDSQAALRKFAAALCADMDAHPRNYAIPVDKYPDEEKFNKKRLNVSRIVIGVVFDYLYKLGLMGTFSDGRLEVDVPIYDEVVAEKHKRIPIDLLNEALSRLGLAITRGHKVSISSPSSPGMCGALGDLAKACSRYKNRELYLFRRFDFRVLEPDYSLDIEDVLNVLDAARRDAVFETDSFLINARYKRKIEPYQDFGYRLVYSNKAGVVCYIHVNSYFDKPLYAYIRWVLDTDQSRNLFKLVDADDPGYANYVFEHICLCDPECIPGFGAQSPESCIARVLVEYGDESAYVCKDARWNVYNDVSEDLAFVRTVLHAVSRVLYEKG